jgi:hypothetical protein
MSCLTAFRSDTASIDFATLMLSPVKIAWSTRKLLEAMESILQSAGILSPTVTEMMSPGTSSDACIFDRIPARNTFASSGEYSLSAYFMVEICKF